MEYHPRSQRPTKFAKFEDFRRREPIQVDAGSADPWKPFQLRADFEFAELALEAALNKRQVEKLISIFERCTNGQDTFSIKNHKNISGKMHQQWLPWWVSTSYFTLDRDP